MMALLVSALTAGFVGSAHCIGMCGGLVAAYAGASRGSAGRHGWFQGGRTLSYTIIGAVAGTLGSAVDLAGASLGLSRVALVTAGSLMILNGLVALLQLAGVSVTWLHAPRQLNRVTAWIGPRLKTMSPNVRAGVLGVTTGILPCGFLWTFALAAAGTGHIGAGALVMFAFALGTAPATLGLGALIGVSFGRLGRHASLIGAVFVLSAGVWTIVHRSSFDPALWLPAPPAPAAEMAPVAPPSGEPPCCHDEKDAPK
jgi:sulfite exporter TauE/SafE